MAIALGRSDLSFTNIDLSDEIGGSLADLTSQGV